MVKMTLFFSNNTKKTIEFDSKEEAWLYAQMEGDHVVEFTIEEFPDE